MSRRIQLEVYILYILVLSLARFVAEVVGSVWGNQGIKVSTFAIYACIPLDMASRQMLDVAGSFICL